MSSMIAGAGPPDRSLELAHDRYQAAQAAFLALPTRQTGNSYRERAFTFWKRLSGSSAGWDAEERRLDRAIDRAIAAAEEGR